MLLAAGAGIGAYLLHSYAELRGWYLGLNNCFYQVETWSEKFFTPAVKNQGNQLGLLGLVLCLFGAGYLVYHSRQAPVPEPSALPNQNWRPDVLYLLPVLAVASGVWWWGNVRVAPGTDEIFSALYCAKVPPFQTVAYYMLPNNHLLFNLLNGILFGRADNLVATGRWLSGGAYLATVVLAYGWLRPLLKYRLLTAFVTLILALQFPLWAFGFQARGYALYALMHWGAFVTLFNYLRERRRNDMLVNALCCVAGYALVPTFLYFHLAQLAFGVVYQLLHREIDWRFWRYQMAVLVAVYLFYLPALCFSGLAAITSNEYVRPKSETLQQFLPIMGQDFGNYATYCFSRAKVLGVQLSYALALVPLLLLAARRNTVWFAYGLFYALLLALLVATTLGMRRGTNERNLVGHFSLALALVPVALYWLLARLPAHWQTRRWQLGTITGVLLVLGAKFVKANPIVKSENIYFFDNNKTYRKLETALGGIPTNRTVAFSWESFSAYHINAQRGLQCFLPCEASETDYYVVNYKEQLPSGLAKQYRMVRKIPQHKIYQRLN